VNVGSGPAAVSVKASGPARGALRGEGKMTASALDASASGTARLFADKPAANLRVSVTRADAAPLRGVAGGQKPLPVTYAGRVALSGNELTFSDINAAVDGASVRGRLALTLDEPHRVQGELETDNLDGAALVAATIGMPTASDKPSVAWSWSSEPFADNALGIFTGQVAVKARRARLLPQLVAREFRATVRVANNEIAFEDVAGELAGGQLAGRLSFRAGDDGLKANAKFSLSGADAAGILSAGARPSVTGTLGLSAEVEGTGLSPVALIGSLQGNGKITLANAQFAGLDPRAFDAVTRAVDQGLAIDAARISDVVRKALASGQLSVKRAQGAIAISAGQVRLSKAIADSQDAELDMSGNLDLTDGVIDARLVLSGTSEAGGARPDIYMALRGPVAAPARSIDVSALTGWLTLRGVENQAKKLREIEEAAKKAPPPTPPRRP
jgi:hypothetical protein